MRIKKIVIMAIRGNTELRRKLKDALGISEPTLNRLLANQPNDDLTKAIALKVIQEELDLNNDEILEEESEVKEEAQN